VSKQKTNTALPLYASVITATVIAVAWVCYRNFYAPEQPAEKERANTAAAQDAGPADDAITDEDERLQYVVASIEVPDLSISHDQKPDDAGPVKGLLKVSGTALNKGARAIRSLRVIIHLQSASGTVLGTYLEDVLNGSRLGPTEKKPFKFIIPEKPEFAGQFKSELR
jgi:hypothetical protein